MLLSFSRPAIKEASLPLSNSDSTIAEADLVSTTILCSTSADLVVPEAEDKDINISADINILAVPFCEAPEIIISPSPHINLGEASTAATPLSELIATDGAYDRNELTKDRVDQLTSAPTSAHEVFDPGISLPVIVGTSMVLRSASRRLASQQPLDQAK